MSRRLGRRLSQNMDGRGRESQIEAKTEIDENWSLSAMQSHEKEDPK